MNTLNLTVKTLCEKVVELEKRVKYLEDLNKILEQENVGTTNALYEVENRLQAQLDALINYTMMTDVFPTPNDVY